MKIYKVITIILLLISAKLSLGQIDGDKKKFKDEIDKIVKNKLIDSVGLNEMTADKFLSLYRDNNKQIRSLNKEKRDLMESIELDPGAIDVDTKFNKMLELESNILDKRKSFFQDLKTFLTPQQIAKTLILRKKIGREIKKEIMRHKRDGRNKEKKDEYQ